MPRGDKVGKGKRLNFLIPKAEKQQVIITQQRKEADRLARMGFTMRRSKRVGGYVLRKRLHAWEFFQDKVRAFLAAWNCEDVESGQVSWLGRYQIDVVGGYDGTLLVFECKSSRQPNLKKLTREINIFAGKKMEIEAGIREKFKSKYNEVKYVLALEGIDVADEDWLTARQNDIFIWPDGYLTVVGDLFSIIGPRSIHYVLKELGISPKLVRDGDGGFDYKVPAFRITINRQQIFSFFLPAEKLLNLLYVFRLQPGNQDAYQRFVSKARIFGTVDEPGISDFIRKGGFFKNTIVCSFERQVSFEPKPTGLLLESDHEFGVLSIPKYHGTVWVIDGQHRIYGYAGVPSELQRTPLGVVAYQDLEKQLQARDFIDINQKQKSVDPNTLWELLAQTDPRSLSGAITRLVKILGDRGFFEGKIFMPGRALRHGRRKYPLKLANICTSIYDLGLLDRQDRDNLYAKTENVTEDDRYPDAVLRRAASVIDQYFTLVWDIAGAATPWRQGFILHNNGVNVFLRVLSEILRFQRGDWNRSAARDLLSGPLGQFFEERYTQISEIRITQTSNEAGRARVALDIIRSINKHNGLFAHSTVVEAEKREKAEYEKSEPYQVLMRIETELRQFIIRKLSASGPSWWKHRVPGDIQEKVQQRLKKDEKLYPWIMDDKKQPIHYVDFPDYGKIITSGENWKEEFGKVFGEMDVLRAKLRELGEIRNKVAHYRPLSLQETKVLALYAEMILTAITPAANLPGSSRPL